MNRKFLSLTIISLMLVGLITTHATANSGVISKATPTPSMQTELPINQTISINNACTQSISEYDMIKHLQHYSSNQLKGLGYSKLDIKQIRQPLKSKEHYGKLTYTISYSKFYIKKKTTYLKTKMTWNWSKKPICLLSDIAAMTTSESFTKDSAKATIQYYSYGNKKKKGAVTHPSVKTKNSGRGVYIYIPMGKNWSRDGRCYRNIALSGSISTSWSVGKKLSQFGISSNYGHTIAFCSPSVSFGSGTSIGFSPYLTCSSGDEAYQKVKTKKK